MIEYLTSSIFILISQVKNYSTKDIWYRGVQSKKSAPNICLSIHLRVCYDDFGILELILPEIDFDLMILLRSFYKISFV